MIFIFVYRVKKNQYIYPEDELFTLFEADISVL